MANAHKNAVFVLGDGCRELSTARHEPCGVHLAAVRQATDCRNLPRNLPPCMLPGTAPRATYCRAYRRGATAEELPQKATAVCYRRHAYPSDNLPAVHAAATCRQTYQPGTLPTDNLPAAHTTVHTAVALPPRRYLKKLPPCATAEELPPCMPPGHTTLLWIPRPAGG